MRAFWHSFVDVQAMDRVGGGLGYLKKYLLKCVDVEKADGKALLTLAITWAFRKRSFSISGKFYCVLKDLSETSEEESNGDGYHIEDVYFVIGFVSIHLIGLEPDIWFKQLDAKWVDSFLKGV